MAENKTKIDDLNESASSGELTDSEAGQISGGQGQQQQPIEAYGTEDKEKGGTVR